MGKKERDMEYKRSSLKEVDYEGRKIFGLASAFGNKDLVGDIVLPGAFKKTLEEDKKRIKVFYNHTQPIGMPTMMEEQEKGLYVEGRISKTSKGDEILELIKDGVINEMSIAYEVMQSDDTDEARLLKEIKLYEFGPVDFAANPGAIIEGVKTLSDRVETLGRIDEKKLNTIRESLKNLLDAIDRTVQPEQGEAVPESSVIDTRLMKLSEELSDRLAKAFRIK